MKLKLLTRAAAILLLMAVAAAAGAAPATESAAAPAPHSAIPFKQDKQSGNAMALQSLAGVVLAGLAAYGAVLALKRRRGGASGPARSQRRLHILESKRLGRGSALHVVTYHDQELLLAESEHGVQLLSSRALPAAEAEHV